jgi:uncharacterized protein (DUF1330 family)
VNLMIRKACLLSLVVIGLLAVAAVGVVYAATPAAKGYVIAEITVIDAEAYKQYAAAVPAIAAKFGGKYLVRGGQTVAIEGEPPEGRIVVLEFESLAAARSFENSADYQAIAPLRQKAARSRVFLAEGLGP